MRALSKATLAVGTAALLVTATGVAYAYWTTQGSGSGSASSGTAVAADAIQLTQANPITGLYPGGPVGAIIVTATNPAAFHQVVGEVTVTPTYPSACPAANWTVVNADDAFGDLAPGGSNTLTVGSIALNETGVNQDSCKSVTPSFQFSSAAGE